MVNRRHFRGQPRNIALEAAANETATVFRITAAKPRLRKRRESSSHPLGNLISDCPSFETPSRDLEKSSLDPSPTLQANHSKRWSSVRRRVTKQEKRRETGFGNEYFSNAKTVSPAEAIDGVVKRIDLFGSIFFSQEESFKRTEKTESTGAVGQVVDGIRRQHASRRFQP